MEKIETIKVKRDGPKGYRIINKSSYDPAKHELLDAAPAGDKEPKGMTAAEIKAVLDGKGIAYKSNASKADLQALLDAAQ